MGSQLIAAFLAISLLSLLFMLFIGLGMCLANARRRTLWRLLVLPALSLLLVWQYAVLIGWPPFLQPQPGDSPKHPTLAPRGREGVIGLTYPAPLPYMKSGEPPPPSLSLPHSAHIHLEQLRDAPYAGHILVEIGGINILVEIIGMNNVERAILTLVLVWQMSRL